ncbi:MAG: hypothetical protein KGL10_04735 [Alphaproteobacteria bacterium]|nr:hypothetical protein [Alphaproteobacteria bacterium]
MIFKLIGKPDIKSKRHIVDKGMFWQYLGMRSVCRHLFWVIAMCAALSGCAGVSGTAHGNNGGVRASANVLKW